MKKDQYAEHVSKLHTVYNAELRSALSSPLGDAKNPDVWPSVKPIYESFVKEMDELHKVYTSENGDGSKS